LIFEEKNGDVTDIFSSFDFNSDDYDEIDGCVMMCFKEDEEVNFKPSNFYLVNLQKCQKAYNELFQHENQLIDSSIFIPWLEKHTELGNSTRGLSFRYANFMDFEELYYKLSNLKNYLVTNDIAKEAVEAYHQINEDDENSLLRWLIKYGNIDNYDGEYKLGQYGLLQIKHEPNNPYFKIQEVKFNFSEVEALVNFKFISYMITSTGRSFMNTPLSVWISKMNTSMMGEKKQKWRFPYLII
jgi:hypothetical protein